MGAIDQSEIELSITEVVQKWLERTPGLEFEGFNFWGKYQKAVNKLLDDQRKLAEVCLTIKLQNSNFIANFRVKNRKDCEIIVCPIWIRGRKYTSQYLIQKCTQL